MKKMICKASLLAVIATIPSVASAGTVAPGTAGAATKYASEALASRGAGTSSATDVTLVPLVYTMGVARTTAQDFVMIVNPPANSTFDPASCTAAAPVVAGGGAAATVSVRRNSASECTYEVDVTTAFTTATTLTLTGLKLDTQTLDVPGGTANLAVSLKDMSESAYVDQTGSLTAYMGVGVQAVNIYAAAKDTATTADVNNGNGPLFGFLAAGDDLAGVAKASLTFDNNSANAVVADGATLFDFKTTTGTATVNLNDSLNFQALATNGLCIDFSGNGTCDAGEILTPTAGTATLTNIASAKFPAQGPTALTPVLYNASGTASLGTQRVIGVTGTITPQVGGAESLADTGGAGFNAAWWTWTANATQLWAPAFNRVGNQKVMFKLTNTTNQNIQYSVQCYAANTVAVVSNPVAGTIPANSVATFNDGMACTFPSGATVAGSVVFTINAPAGSIKGSVQQTNKTTGDVSYETMERPFAANTF